MWNQAKINYQAVSIASRPSWGSVPCIISRWLVKKLEKGQGILLVTCSTPFVLIMIIQCAYIFVLYSYPFLDTNFVFVKITAHIKMLTIMFLSPMPAQLTRSWVEQVFSSTDMHAWELVTETHFIWGINHSIRIFFFFFCLLIWALNLIFLFFFYNIPTELSP